MSPCRLRRVTATTAAMAVAAIKQAAEVMEIDLARATLAVVGATGSIGAVDFHFDFGFPPRTSYACMAETMALALEGRYESARWEEI